jgi:hypothetical protein
MQNFLGRDGFIWWVGVVEDVIDPDVLGRCKVRVFGYHDNTSQIPTADLPWATSIHSPNTPNLYSPLAVGDWVFGFFLDSINAQEPAIVGFIPTIKNPRNFKRVKDLGNVDIRTCWELGNNYIEVIKDGYIEIYQKTGSRINFDIEGNIIANSNANSIICIANTDFSSTVKNNTTFLSGNNFSTTANSNVSISAARNLIETVGNTYSLIVNGTSTTSNTSIVANNSSLIVKSGTSSFEGNTYVQVTSGADIGLKTANNDVSVDTLVAWIKAAWSEANSAHSKANTALVTATAATVRLNSPTYSNGYITSI